MKKSSTPPDCSRCPCGHPLDYADCCGRYHAGAAVPDAETLMRSRYSAYVLALEAYLLATWHADTRPEKLDLAAEPGARWLGLQVKRCEISETGNADIAFVEFVARYKTGGRARRLHENSRFVRVNGCWHYVDGEFPQGGDAP